MIAYDRGTYAYTDGSVIASRATFSTKIQQNYECDRIIVPFSCGSRPPASKFTSSGSDGPSVVEPDGRCRIGCSSGSTNPSLLGMEHSLREPKRPKWQHPFFFSSSLISEKGASLFSQNVHRTRALPGVSEETNHHQPIYLSKGLHLHFHFEFLLLSSCAPLLPPHLPSNTHPNNWHKCLFTLPHNSSFHLQKFSLINAPFFASTGRTLRR